MATYRIIRKKIGDGWKLKDGERSDSLILTSDDKTEAEQFMNDDIEDMRAKYPELGEAQAGASWLHGPVRYRHLGDENFGLVYMFDTTM